jgi:hypothetical protein
MSTTVATTTANADAPAIRDANGDTAFRNVVLAGPTNMRGSVTYPGVGVDPAATASIASGSNFPIATASDNGFVFIETSNAESAIAHIRGGLSAASIALAVQGTWGTTAGAANNFNVYWDAGTSTYRIENRVGTARTFKILKVGFFSTQ